MGARLRMRLGGWRGYAAAVLVAAGLWNIPARAQDVDPLVGLSIDQAVADGDIAKALGLIDGALSTSDYWRFDYDLLVRKAELLHGAGRTAEAAAAWLAVADFVAAREGGATSPDLIPALEAAAAAFEAIGDNASATQALTRLLAVLTAAGLAERGEQVAARLEAIGAGTGEAIEAAAVEAIQAFREAVQQTDRAIFNVDPEQGFTSVKIYYATDRARSGSEDPNDFYGGDRGELELGTAVVSIPPQHTPGAIERPSIWTFTFREDPGRHVVLQSVTPGENDKVFAEMREQLGSAGSDSAFVFVHGFNVPFFEAAQRTAQMAYDMNFDGVPILYSWPSRASLLSYIADTAVVNLSGRRLTLFLEDVVKKSGAKRIHLIAHSMGNRAMTDALELYALRHKGEPPAFDQVLFTAPDLDAGLFAEMAKTIQPVAQRLTLYASDKDWALAVSRKLHGDATRAGQGGKRILHSAAVDSIDMTSIGEDMLMHSYYANNPSALTDILALMWRDAGPEERCGMTKVDGENGSFWEYKPEDCDGNALLSTLSILRKASIVTFPDARAFMNRFIMPATTDPNERSRLEKALARLFGQG
ncbi:MAG: alpha/beta hydrolase [Rhizobiaceae bacterium]|nr:alpha/beta hydrolase [Rhizobiaceae bacterium]